MDRSRLRRCAGMRYAQLDPILIELSMEKNSQYYILLEDIKPRGLPKGDPSQATYFRR
jgi:hypothetical protein